MLAVNEPATMHIVLDEPSFPAYRCAIRSLIRGGARRFLFHGWGPVGQALHASIASEGSRWGTNIVLTCRATGAGAPIAMLSREQALAMSWDAVVVLPTERLRDAVSEAMSHAASRGVVYPGRRPPFVGVVAVHKGGTNLLAEMMKAFGYKVMGMGVISDLPVPGPELSWEEREWQYISSAPPYSCYFTHSLPVHNGDNVGHRPLLTHWCRESFPLIFIYRDPRAVLCSFVHYVLGKGRSQEFTKTPCATVYSAILGNIGDTHVRTRVAIECLQQYFSRSFREHVWLLHHPSVHRTSYERLVGPEGEGDKAAQIQEVAAAMIYLNVGGDPAEIARRLYNRDVRTFVRGNAHGWRDELGPENLRDFNRLYADILITYGYPIVEY